MKQLQKIFFTILTIVFYNNIICMEKSDENKLEITNQPTILESLPQGIILRISELLIKNDFEINPGAYSDAINFLSLNKKFRKIKFANFFKNEFILKHIIAYGSNQKNMVHKQDNEILKLKKDLAEQIKENKEILISYKKLEQKINDQPSPRTFYMKKLF